MNERRREKVAESVARQIAREISAENLKIGMPLPSESDLMSNYNISRDSLHEALRILEVEGVIVSRRRGTTTIRQVIGDDFGHLASFYLHARGATYRELFEARLLLEPLMMARAAERAAVADTSTLKELVTRLRIPPPEGESVHEQEERAFIEGSALLQAISDLVGNQVLSLFVASLRSLFNEAVVVLIASSSAITKTRPKFLMTANAILAKNPTRAATMSRAAVNGVYKAISNSIPGILDEVITWRTRTSDLAFRLVPGQSGYEEPIFGSDVEKAATTLARLIARETFGKNIPSGTPLSKEQEMVASFGVARSTLRQALRLLEVYGLIIIKTGPEGGPYVAQPTTQQFANMARLHFQMHRVTFGQLLETRCILEPALAGLASRRRNPDFDERLRLIAGAGGETSGDGGQFTPDIGEFHEFLATSSGNRILDLYTGALWYIYTQFTTGPRFSPKVHDALLREHKGITTAIVSRSATNATQLTHDHMVGLLKAVRDHSPAMIGHIVGW
jgi:GntR family transcriptional regulator, transcriptional repressor for pyruvate dehydrogenase complex